MSAQQLKIRRIVWTGAITAVTVTGAWYGAELKTQSETKEVVQKRKEATIEERLEQLEKQKRVLMKAKVELERKLADLEGKMEEKARIDQTNGAKGA